MTDGKSRDRTQRVLLFTYFLDPVQAGADVVASIRPNLLVRYLPSNGWQPTIVTSSGVAPEAYAGLARVVPVESGSLAGIKRRAGLDVSTLVKTQSDHAGPRSLPARLRFRVRAAATELAAFVPDRLVWTIRAARAGVALARAERFSVVYSTSPTPATHLAAWYVSVRCGIPWVAELRDLWSQHADRPGTRGRRVLDRLLERALFRRAGAIVTVSEPLARQLASLHRNTPVRAIETGFDPDLLSPEGQHVVRTFTVVYAGRMFSRQSLAPFFQAVRSAADAGLIKLDDVRIELFTMGTLSGADRDVVHASGLAGVTTEHERVSREEAVEAERRAQVLLHARWDVADQKGLLTGKLFEYLAARRPILSIGAFRDAVSELLEETGTGVATNSEEETMRWLGSAFHAYKSGGAVPYHGLTASLERYDARRTARRIAAVLDAVAIRATVPRV